MLLLISVATLGSAAVYLLYPSGEAGFKHVKPGGAAIVDALTELSPNPVFEEQATAYLASVGMYVDVYNASAVSVDFMKSFPAGYDLIVFRVHSGTSRHGVFYFTSEPYDESKHQPEQFRDEVRPAKDYEGHAQVFAFGPKFVNTYLKNRFENAVIIGMGCFGAGTSYGSEEEVAIENVEVRSEPNLADAFHRQGASVLIGWDKLVSLSFSDEASLRLIKALAVDHLTVKQAVDTTNQEFGPDPVYKSVLLFYPEENGDEALRIQTLEDGAREISEGLFLSVYSMMPRPRIWQSH